MHPGSDLSQLNEAASLSRTVKGQTKVTPRYETALEATQVLNIDESLKTVLETYIKGLLNSPQQPLPSQPVAGCMTYIELLQSSSWEWASVSKESVPRRVAQIVNCLHKAVVLWDIARKPLLSFHQVNVLRWRFRRMINDDLRFLCEFQGKPAAEWRFQDPWDPKVDPSSTPLDTLEIDLQRMASLDEGIPLSQSYRVPSEHIRLPSAINTQLERDQDDFTRITKSLRKSPIFYDPVTKQWNSLLHEKLLDLFDVSFYTPLPPRLNPTCSGCRRRRPGQESQAGISGCCRV